MDSNEVRKVSLFHQLVTTSDYVVQTLFCVTNSVNKLIPDMIGLSNTQILVWCL